MSDKRTEAQKRKAVDIDLDALEGQIEMEVDRLFPVSSSSTEWREKLQKKSSTGERRRAPLESQSLSSERSGADDSPLRQEKKQSLGERGIEIDLDAFEEQVGLEIDKLLNVTVVPLPDAERLPEVGSAKEVLQPEIEFNPPLQEAPQAIPSAGDREQGKGTACKRSDDTPIKDLSVEDRANPTSDKLFPTASNSRPPVEPLPIVDSCGEENRESEPLVLDDFDMSWFEETSQELPEAEESLSGITDEETELADFAEPLALGLPKRADTRAPLAAGENDLELGAPQRDAGLGRNLTSIAQESKGTGPESESIAKSEVPPRPTQGIVSSPRRSSKLFESDAQISPVPAQPEEAESCAKLSLETPEHLAGSSQRTEADRKSKLIESLSVAFLTLEWDFTVESVAGMDHALMNLEPYCLEIHEADSIAKVLRAVLQRLKAQPDSVSSALIQFISDASTFLLLLLRSQTSPGPRENDELNSLIDRLRTIKTQGGRKDPNGEMMAAVVQSLGTTPESEELPLPPASAREPEVPAEDEAAKEEILDFSTLQTFLDASGVACKEPAELTLEEPAETEYFAHVKSSELEAEKSQVFEPAPLFERPSQSMPRRESSEDQGAFIEPPPDQAMDMQQGVTRAAESGDIKQRSSEAIGSDELAWLFESLDIAFVSLEWDFSAENVEVLAHSITYLEPYFTGLHEADSIARVLQAILQRLKSRPDSAFPDLIDFISRALEFLKRCIRTETSQADQNREQLRHLINALRKLDAHPGVSLPGQADPVSPSLAQATEANEIPLLLFDSVDTAYICLFWSFGVENVAALDRGIVNLEPHLGKSREAGSISRVLRAVLQRLKSRPDSVSPPLLGFLSDALEYFKVCLCVGDSLAAEDKDRLKSLIDRLRIIKSESARDDEGDDGTTDSAHPSESGLTEYAPQPMGLEMLGALDGKSVQEFRVWMESWWKRSEDAAQSLESEVNRLLQIEKVLTKKPVLAPLVSRLSRVRETLAEQIAAGYGAKQEWSNRLNQLLDWEQRLSASPFDTEMYLAPEQVDLTGTDTPQIPDVESEGLLPEEEKQVDPVDQQVCLFDLAGERLAVLASQVVKFQRASDKQAQKLMERGYATLKDFKPLFKGLKSGLMGEWNNVPSKDLKTYRFLSLSHDLLGCARASSTDPCDTDSGRPAAPPSAVGGVVLVSNASSHGMLFIASTAVDLRNETIELVSGDKTTYGIIRTGSHPPIRVLNLDTLLLNTL